MALKNGLIGGIRSTFWRRVAMIFLMAPGVLLVCAGPLLRHLPIALSNAWDAFAESYDGPGERLLLLGWKKSWSSDWTPVP